MRVTGLSIDGFGVFCGREFRNLATGLTVLYGPNEAGKSTLLAFVRGVVFGFPRPAKNRRPFYPPLAGGRHGGRVFLKTEGGTITIEREVGGRGRLLLESAPGMLEELTDGDFQRLIGGVDDKTFRTIFAFSLDELSDFDILSGEQVRARIFAAGVGGAGPSVRDVIQGFERTCGGLLKPRSREAEINSLLAELTAHEHRLQEARSRAESYPALLLEGASTRALLERLDAREQECRSTQAMNERLLALWPVWVDLDSSRRHLASLEDIDEFVPDALRRLTEAKQRLESVRASVRRLEDRATRRADDIERLSAAMSEELRELAPRVERQMELLPLYRDRLREREVLRARASAAADRLRQALSDLGHSVDEQTLAVTDTSLPRLEEIRAWKARLGEAGLHTRQAAERFELAEDQRVKAEAERDREYERLLSLPQVDHDALGARVQALRELRASTADLRAKQAVLEGRLSAAAAFAAGRHEDRASGKSATPLLVAAAALTVLVLAATVALAVTGQAAAAAALAVLTALGLGICTALLLRARLGRRSPGGALGLTMEAAQREEQEQESLRRDIRELKTRMEIPAEILGVFRLGDPQEMERIDASLAEDASRAARATEQSAAFAKASERAAELLLDESSAEGRLERAQDEQRALECEFRARMVTGGLPASLSHEGVEEYLRGIAGAKELVARRDNESLQVSRMEEEVAGWEGESAGLVAAARALGVTGDSDPSGGQAGPAVEVALLALAARCRAEIVLQQQVVDLGNDKRELEVEIEVARVEAAAGAEEWAGLLAQAGAGDEEDFLGRLAVYERRQELRQNIAVGEDLVIKSVGKGPEADGLRGILGRGEISLWEERLQEAKAGIEEVRLQRAEALKLEGDIERRLRDLEEAADVPSLEIVIEGLRAALETALEQWRVHHLAGVLVRDTLTQFTQERQPLVLAEASRMFERVTEGRYVRVQRAVDDEGLVVVQADGRVKSPEELSRGAAEQLYLCVRLGLAEEFARRAEPMPLVMDDVLVNFDAARRWATAELLVEFSERHQILLFTCHEEIAQLFGRLKPGIATLELS